MDKYRKVIKDKVQEEDVKENEVRVTQKGKVRNSISYVHSLFEVRAEREREQKQRKSFVFASIDGLMLIVHNRKKNCEQFI